MLKELKFVQGAVARKEMIPSLTHFRIENGNVRSFNGTLALSSPIAFDIDCTPRAVPFVKAIENCDETVTLSMTPKGRLSVKSGSFKAFIDCVSDETPHVEPEGDRFELDGEAMLEAMKACYPFVGTDASRPWSTGLLLCNQSAFATNNIVMIEYWIGQQFPIVCNVPAIAIREMLRIGEPPIYGQATDHCISFHYEDGRWIRTALLDLSWPDLNKVMEKTPPDLCKPIEDKIFDALGVLKPFTDDLGRVYFCEGSIATSIIDTEGASFDIEGFDLEGAYNIEMLSLLQGVASSVDFDAYPRACVFYGDKLRGAIIGMRI